MIPPAKNYGWLIRQTDGERVYYLQEGFDSRFSASKVSARIFPSRIKAEKYLNVLRPRGSGFVFDVVGI